MMYSGCTTGREYVDDVSSGARGPVYPLGFDEFNCRRACGVPCVLDGPMGRLEGQVSG